MQRSQASCRHYDDLPRPGEGLDSCTREVIRLLPPLRTPPAILGLGCRRGYQAITLAGHFKAPVTVVDDDAQSLQRLTDAAHAAGVADLLQTRVGAIDALEDAPQSYDLIWSETGVRRLGFTRALDLWQPLLRSRGVMVLGDCCWLVPDPPADAAAFWDGIYPGMTDIASLHALAKRANMRIDDSYAIPRSVWRNEYFDPLARRVARRRKEEAAPADSATLDMAEKEIAMFDRWGDRLQYTYFLLRRVQATT
jgi:hypothetical protein